MVSCQKGPTRHAYAWQIGPFWQDTLYVPFTSKWFHGKLIVMIFYSFEITASSPGANGLMRSCSKVIDEGIMGLFEYKFMFHYNMACAL